MGKVRGHYRNLPNGKRVFVQDHERTDSSPSDAHPVEAMASEEIDAFDDISDEKWNQLWGEVFEHPRVKEHFAEYGSKVAVMRLHAIREASEEGLALEKRGEEDRWDEEQRYARAYVAGVPADLISKNLTDIETAIKSDTEQDWSFSYDIEKHLPSDLGEANIPSHWDVETLERASGGDCLMDVDKAHLGAKDINQEELDDLDIKLDRNVLKTIADLDLRVAKIPDYKYANQFYDGMSDRSQVIRDEIHKTIDDWRFNIQRAAANHFERACVERIEALKNA